MSKKSKKRSANRNYQTQNQRGSSNPANGEHQKEKLKEKLIYDRVETGVDQDEAVRVAVADAVMEEEHTWEKTMPYVTKNCRDKRRVVVPAFL